MKACRKIDQANYLRYILLPKENIFINSVALFESLVGNEPTEEKELHTGNPFGYYNYHETIKNNIPAIYDQDNLQTLKPKILFNEYKFRNLHKTSNIITIEIDHWF